MNNAHAPNVVNVDFHIEYVEVSDLHKQNARKNTVLYFDCSVNEWYFVKINYINGQVY